MLQDNKEIKKNKVIFAKIISITLGVAGLVLVLLIIGVGALLAGRVWDPKWNPFKPPKERTTQNNINLDMEK